MTTQAIGKKAPSYNTALDNIKTWFKSIANQSKAEVFIKPEKGQLNPHPKGNVSWQKEFYSRRM